MTPGDKKAFSEVLMGFAVLKGKDLPRPAIELFWLAMQDWSIDDFKAAAIHLIKTCTFFPIPKDFEDCRKASMPTAGEVFGQVARYIDYSPQGYSVSPNAPRRIAASIRAMGGANAYAMCDSDKLHFLEKRFCEHYEAIGEAEDTRQALPQLTGPNRLQLTDVVKRIA